MREDELLFSEVRTKIGHIFGMDASICAQRTMDLISSGLVRASEPSLHAQTYLTATPLLVDSFDHHTVEASELLHVQAKLLDSRLPRMSSMTPSRALNKRFIRFFEDFLKDWNEHRTSFLKKSAEKNERLRNPVVRVKANNALKTQPYWYIFIIAWLWRHPDGQAPRSYVLVEDFLDPIHKLLQYNGTTTRGYVQDMIDWGFLERQYRADGVPRNKFAVRMTSDAFEDFGRAFAQAGPLLVGAARDISRLSHGPDSGELVPLRVVS
ncbi:MAG TPA: hypothetical protein VK438_12625 [Xanthobacteraceae bacterium]|nr:hypothetical protein [Xanthobacteraceae bacterium]